MKGRDSDVLGVRNYRALPAFGGREAKRRDFSCMRNMYVPHHGFPQGAENSNKTNDTFALVSTLAEEFKLSKLS